MALSRYLPQSFESAAPIIEASALELSKPNAHVGSEFTAWPLVDYIGTYGRSEPVLALSLLEKLTHLFTAEFAIRPFVENEFDTVLPYLIRWVKSGSEHVRRLASEGIRPRLPWGGHLKKLKADPAAILPILESLKDDESLYVRKSVANNLNDISKDHPELVLQICQAWLQGGSQNTRWIIQHGLRTLIKQGHPAVFPMLGYSSMAFISKASLRVDKQIITIGESILLEVELISDSVQVERYVIDYCVYHIGADGKIRPKVYKLKNTNLLSKQSLRFSKSHAFKPLATRCYHPGIHKIVLLVNGKTVSQVDVKLQAAIT